MTTSCVEVRVSTDVGCCVCCQKSRGVSFRLYGWTGLVLGDVGRAVDRKGVCFFCFCSCFYYLEGGFLFEVVDISK